MTPSLRRNSSPSPGPNGTAIGGNSFPLSAVRPAKETVREWKATLQEADD
jgi:hypothetical protein